MLIFIELQKHEQYRECYATQSYSENSPRVARSDGKKRENGSTQDTASCLSNQDIILDSDPTEFPVFFDFIVANKGFQVPLGFHLSMSSGMK